MNSNNERLQILYDSLVRGLKMLKLTKPAKFGAFPKSSPEVSSKACIAC